jgi:hypothetical protein
VGLVRRSLAVTASFNELTDLAPGWGWMLVSTMSLQTPPTRSQGGTKINALTPAHDGTVA